MSWRKVIDIQWEKISEHLPVRKKSPKGGRPPADNKKCFEGILWIFWTGAPWSELPSRYGSKNTLHRRTPRMDREWDFRASLEGLFKPTTRERTDSME